MIKDLLAEALPEECWELVLDSTGGQFLDSTGGQCSVFTVASVNSAIALTIAQPFPPCLYPRYLCRYVRYSCQCFDQGMDMKSPFSYILRRKRKGLSHCKDCQKISTFKCQKNVIN